MAVCAGCRGGLTIAATAIRLARLTGRWGLWGLWGGVAAESALLFGLYALWQFAGSFTVMSAAGAVPRARWLWHAERVLLLPSETAVQRPFLSHPILVQAFNLYYDVLHFPILGACLIWLYARHRDFYPRVRTTVALFTGVSLLIQLIPVAPPRLLPATGMVDTAVRYGQLVYSWQGGFDADEFSAMPSVHVGCALIVAIAVITVSRNRWRWLAAGYPVLTLLVVVVTANHFWLDGIVAAVADWREADVFDDGERTVLALADAICDGEVPGSLAHEVEQRFGSRGLVELAVTASAYVMVPRVLSALGVEIESGEAS